jgi:putative CocE/NonD family hydrolase
LVITPSAHNLPGYREGSESHAELRINYRTYAIIDLLLLWYEKQRSGRLEDWPKVIYYLMGANRWCSSSSWPPPDCIPVDLFLKGQGRLCLDADAESASTAFTYDPLLPTPTLGGSIVSHVLPVGSVNVASVQARSDVICFTTPRLQSHFDHIGPLRVHLFAATTATDTDFVARLSDVHPDGRAIQIQAAILRGRYRDLRAGPQALVPGEVHELELDLWGSAHRFQEGHQIRLDLASADFPNFTRHSNRVDPLLKPVPATQTIFYGGRYPSRLKLCAPRPPRFA